VLNKQKSGVVAAAPSWLVEVKEAQVVHLREEERRYGTTFADF
jgi:hypothetical protein